MGSQTTYMLERNVVRAGASHDLHGAALHTFASVLTDDPEYATTLVIDAIVASVLDRHAAPSDLRALAASACESWDGRISGHVALNDLHRLPDDQRAALALCGFGDHGYVQAAAVLDLPVPVVLDLLREALVTLA